MIPRCRVISGAGLQHSPGFQRPPTVFWGSLWGLGAATVVALAGIEMVLRPDFEVIGRDFVNLWLSGKLALQGEIARIFDVTAYQAAVIEAFGKPLPLNYSYPPHALFLALPFGLLPYYLALALWSLAGVVLFTLAARPYVPFSPVFAALTPAALLCLWFGHYGLIYGALWLLFFRTMGSRTSGLSAAAMTFKPHMGVMVALAAIRNRTTFLWAVAGALVLAGASLMLFGVKSWLAFLTETTAAQRDILVSGDAWSFYYRMMPSSYVAYGRGLPAVIAQAAFAAFALWLALRNRPDPFTYATATFLILPYAFNYDMTVVSLGFAVLLYRHWHQLRLAERAILAGAFLTPQLTFFLNPLVPPLLLGGLWIQTRHLTGAGTEDVRTED